MKKARIWFNHWFSTAYHIINLVKQDQQYAFTIIGSSENPNSVVQLACDEWHIEPHFEEESEYAEYCLQFCKDNQIDVFVPRRGMMAVGYNHFRFEQAGIKVLVEKNFEKLFQLNDKEKTYKLFEQTGIGHVPVRHIVDNKQDFMAAYEAITGEFDRACLKFAVDEGATSFRVIDNTMQGLQSLYRAPGMKITLKDALQVFEDGQEMPKLMVMPYLDGNEISIDCLRTEQGVIAIPRTKADARLQRLLFDEAYLTVADAFYEKIGLEGPCNIQLRYHEDKLYLLEINTRMSGGIQYSYYGTGINIPNLAVNQLLGVHKSWKLEKKEATVSYIETPIGMPVRG